MGINEVLDMPFTFMMDDLHNEHKKPVKKSKSMLQAFGVSGIDVGKRKETKDE